MALLSIALAVLLTAPVHAQRPSIAGLQAQIAALQAYTDPLQTYLSVDESVPAKPVLRVTAANLQVVNGSGLTYNFQNGVGNLIVGYDELRETGDNVCSDGAFTDQIACENATEIWALSHKSGSHNLVVGGAHNYSHTGGLVAGLLNTVNRFAASVSGGAGNTASGHRSSVGGGRDNVASGPASSVSGGQFNVASGSDSSVSGGEDNVAMVQFSSVSGGQTNVASGLRSSVSGGQLNVALGDLSSVSGGTGNTASHTATSVSGGASRTAAGENDWVAGGLFQDF
jgi:hypothetical protein